MRTVGITVVFVSCLLLLGGCANPSVDSGTYIATDDNAALMIELQRGKDTEVSGAVTLVGVDPGGALISGRRPFSGSVSGNTLNLNIENGSGLTIATGIKVDENLDLTLLHDGSSERYTFKRQSPEQFPRVVADFRVRAAALKQAAQEASLNVVHQKALAGYQDRLNKIAAEVTKGAESIAEATSHLNTAAQSYLPVARQVARLRSAEIAASSRLGSDDYRTSQIALVRGQATDATRADHEAVADLVERLRQATDRHDTEVASSNELCRANRALDCRNLNEAMKAYRGASTTFLAAVAREGATFQRHKDDL